MFSLTDLSEGFHQDPYPDYAALREETPVCPQPDGSVILSRYEDLDLIYRDTERFIPDKKAVFGPEFGENSPLYEHHTTSLVFHDAPLHTRMVLDSRPNKHHAFAGGPHTCVGLTLARMDGRVAIGRFSERFPDYQIVDGFSRGEGIRFRGFTQLPAQV